LPLSDYKIQREYSHTKKTNMMGFFVYQSALPAIRGRKKQQQEKIDQLGKGKGKRGFV